MMMKMVMAMLLLAPAAASAMELRVLTAGAYRSVLEEVSPAFEQLAGVHLVIQNGTAGVVQRKVREGEAVDLIVLPIPGIEGLGAMVAKGSMVPLARVGIGVAVKAGAARPDISTPEAVRAAILAARAPAWIDPVAGGSSGIYMSKLVEEWGIAPQLKGRVVLVQGGLVGEMLLAGRADLAFQQASELATLRGVQLIGPLPEAIQMYTVYAAAIPAQSGQASAAAQLIAYLAGPAGVTALAAHGMVAP